MTGFRQVQGYINEEAARDLGTDSYEVSWHAGARPSHQVWQGRVYTMEQLRAVCGLGTVTGLHGANCYHDYTAFILGVSVRTYTDEWLDKQNRIENTPKTYNGKEYTTYEALQQQRRMETAMRKSREDIRLLEEGGADEESIILKKARYQGQMETYRDFSKKMDLPQQMSRVYQDGLRGRFTLTKAEQKALQEKKKGATIKLPRYEEAVIPREKFINYSLNPEKDPHKAAAFKGALGYSIENADDLIMQIRAKLPDCMAVKKGDRGWGMTYEVIMDITGPNGKTAKVLTAWIDDKDNGEIRLTTVHVDK